MIAALIRGLFHLNNHTRGNKRTRSNDKISEVISHFASVQSNSIALEGSCQSMVLQDAHRKKKHKINLKCIKRLMTKPPSPPPAVVARTHEQKDAWIGGRTDEQTNDEGNTQTDGRTTRLKGSRFSVYLLCEAMSNSIRNDSKKYTKHTINKTQTPCIKHTCIVHSNSLVTRYAQVRSYDIQSDATYFQNM